MGHRGGSLFAHHAPEIARLHGLPAQTLRGRARSANCGPPIVGASFGEARAVGACVSWHHGDEATAGPGDELSMDDGPLGTLRAIVEEEVD